LNNKEILIIGLLVVSLGLNYSAWVELKEIRNQQQTLASQKLDCG